VNAGAIGNDGMTQCPKCGKRIDIKSNLHTEGTGCDTVSYLTCPHCGHTYEY